MLLIVFNQFEKTSKIEVPPIYMEITPKLLTTPINEIINTTYKEFKNHISPFITTSNMMLKVDKEVLYRKFPLFMYLNYGDFTQFFTCNVKSVDSVKEEEEKMGHLFLTLVVRARERKTKEAKMMTFRKSDEAAIVKIDNLISKDDKIYLRGK